MRLSVNATIQALGTATQVINQVTDLLTPKGKFWALVTLSAIQGVSAILAHFSNPDGTPAILPYIKETR